jgi:hypothetical protein
VGASWCRFEALTRLDHHVPIFSQLQGWWFFHFSLIDQRLWQLSLAMSSCFSSAPSPGQLHDTKSKSVGRVNTFGQIAVRFHHNPKGLENWFEQAQRDLAGRTCTSHGEGIGTKQQKFDLPAPRLHIAIHICGSRGDVQPFIPIAKILQAPPHRHRVRICTHPAFKGFVVCRCTPCFVSPSKHR